jgi:hypothetical protein
MSKELPDQKKRQGVRKHVARAHELVRKPINKIRRRGVTDTAKVPYITNETIAEHREEVLKGARKFKYPIQHSRRYIVVISVSIFAVLIVSFFTYSLIALYNLQGTSTFMYRITQIVPFPVARVKGAGFVSYESYLFELRHYIHYYETQQKTNLSVGEGKKQLEESKKQSLQRVIDDAYIKELARKHNVSVTSQEVDDEIALLRTQNRLGSSDQVFEDVLRDFWGWSLSDFKRSLRSQLLARKVVSVLDTDAHQRATVAAQELTAGGDFAAIAKKYSDDAVTKDVGGEYAAVVDKSSRDIPPQITKAIFSQQPNEYSAVIDTGYSLEIVKTLSFEGDNARAAHIQVTYKDVGTYLKPTKDKQHDARYIKVE